MTSATPRAPENNHRHGADCCPSPGLEASHSTSSTTTQSPSSPATGSLLWKVLFWVSPALLVTLFAAWKPGDDGFVICPTRRLCGVWCPGCGMTRAIGQLLRGEWSASMAYHPLAPLALAQVVVGWIVFAGYRLQLWARPSNRTIVGVITFDIVILTVVWVLRLNDGSFDNLR